MPDPATSPVVGLLRRLVIALGALTITALIVYFGRDGYTDHNSTTPISLGDAFYYATVAVTTGAAVSSPSSDSAAVVAMKARHAAWTKEQIEEAQEGLAKAGFYKGKASGNFNKATRKAVREYQKANKLPVTGRLSDDLLTRLHSS